MEILTVLDAKLLELSRIMNVPEIKVLISITLAFLINVFEHLD